MSETETRQGVQHLPVNQNPERYFFGVTTVLLGTVAVGAGVDLASGAEPATLHNVYNAVATTAVTPLLGWNALRAHRETKAYASATDEQRFAPETLDLRRFVRNMRTLSWGGASALLTEAGVGGVLLLAEGRKEALGAGLATIAVGGLSKTIPGFLKSWGKGRELKTEKQLVSSEGAVN